MSDHVLFDICMHLKHEDWLRLQAQGQGTVSSRQVCTYLHTYVTTFMQGLAEQHQLKIQNSYCSDFINCVTLQVLFVILSLL